MNIILSNINEYKILKKQINKKLKDKYELYIKNNNISSLIKFF